MSETFFVPPPMDAMVQSGNENEMNATLKQSSSLSSSRLGKMFVSLTSLVSPEYATCNPREIALAAIYTRCLGTD